MGGSGHTFKYNDKLYNTNCADGGDYGKNPDNRDSQNHLFRYAAHAASVKETDTFGTKILRDLNSKDLSYEGDKQRMNYHWIEHNKK